MYLYLYICMYISWNAFPETEVDLSYIISIKNHSGKHMHVEDKYFISLTHGSSGPFVPLRYLPLHPSRNLYLRVVFYEKLAAGLQGISCEMSSSHPFIFLSLSTPFITSTPLYLHLSWSPPLSIFTSLYPHPSLYFPPLSSLSLFLYPSVSYSPFIYVPVRHPSIHLHPVTHPL